MADEMATKGQKARASDLGSKVNGAQLVNGVWIGASDPRSEGTWASVDAKSRIVIKPAQIASDAPTASVH